MGLGLLLCIRIVPGHFLPLPATIPNKKQTLVHHYTYINITHHYSNKLQHASKHLAASAN